jgi:hypothetical protein
MTKVKEERMSKQSEKSEHFMPDDSSDDKSTWGLISIDEAPDPVELLKQPMSGSHLSFRKH